MSFVDERIVKMVFDNNDFGSKISSTIGSINQLNEATDKVANNSNGGLSLMGRAFQNTEALATQAGFHIQDVWQKMANIFEDQIANKIVNTAKKVANAMTIEGISDGFKEYELKMGSIQTIMAGTGEDLATVNKYLEELNTYSDKTIYSFADMTNNIGKFTNAGVKLEDAVAAIKGIANEAAISGANANEASRAMYNFSQALSAGYVKLIDWKSIENANMATKGFKDTLLEVASSCGTVKKGADGMYEVLSTNAQGGTMKESISATKNFNDSLSYQWMTTEVLTKALKIYATDVRDLSAAEKEAFESELKAMGMTDDQIKHFEDLGIKATNAASEIKTFSMLMDTLKEAIGSGWAMTWQTIIGDFEQAKSLWTEVGSVVGGAIDKMSEARNNLLKEGLQTGWEEFINIEDAAIPKSDKFREVLLEIGVANGKLTKEQADAIESTEDLVKSFHELGWVTGDTLRSAVNKYNNQISQMSAEQRKEMGISEAQVKELSNLNHMLKDGTISADDFAEEMKELGGRENIIEGLRNVFHGLIQVLTPIKEAFREVFPPATSQQLYNLTKRFKEFTEKLVASETTITNIRDTARGFFSIFKIAGKLVSSFVKAISPAGSVIHDLSGGLLSITARLGNWITALDKAIEEHRVFENAFKGIPIVINKIGDAMKNFSAEGFKNGISTIVDKIKTFVQNNKALTGIVEFFKKMADGIGDAFDRLKEKLAFFKPLVDGLVSIFKGLVKVVGFVFKSIGNTIQGIKFDNAGIMQLTNLFNSLFGGGVLLKSLTGGGGVGALSSFGEMIENLGGAFESFSKKIQTENLLNIAKAIAILAASLVVVAMVDQNKLLGATTAISTMMMTMAAAMAILMKAVNSFSTADVSKTFKLFGKSIFSTDATSMLKMSVTLKAVSKALIAMGAAVLMMAIGLKVVSSAAEGGHLWDSFAVVSLMLAELVAASILLGKYGNQGAKGAKNLKSLTTALLIMSAALAVVAKVVEGGNAWDALIIVSLMLAELGAIAILIERFGKFEMGKMAGLIALTVALNLAVLAAKKVSDALGADGQRIWEALAVCGAILAGLAGVAVLLGKFGGKGLAGSAGAILAAAALLIVVQSLKQINDMLSSADNNVWASLGVIALALLILSAGLTSMSRAIPGAAALVIASAALVVLAGALKLLGGLSVGEIAKSLITMAIALGILALNLTLMVASLPGAAALLVAAAGLTVLALALKILGSMKIGQIVKALVALAGALIVIGVIGTILGAVSPLLLLFGAAIALVGVGLLGAGLGMTFFAAGLQNLMAVLPLAIESLDKIALLLGSLVIIIINSLFEAIGLIAQKIVEYTPQITAAVLSLLTIILNVLVQAVPQIADAALQIVLGILGVFTEKIPELAQAGTDLIVAFIEAIGNSIPQIVDAAFKCAIALINGLADAIDNNNEELINAVDRLMKAVIDAITQWLVKFTPLGLLMPKKMKEGILSGEFSLWDGFKSIITNTVDKIKNKVADFIQAGKNLIQGLIDGIKGKKKEATDVAQSVGNETVEALNSKKGLDEHSPSVKGYKSGKNLYQGLINGMEDGEKHVKNCALNLSAAIREVLDETSSLATDAIEIHPVISPIVDMTSVKEMENVIGSLNPITSMNMAASVSSLHDSRIKQAEIDSRQIAELNFSSQKIERSIGEMSNEIVRAINNSDTPVNVSVRLDGDAGQIFKVVRTENAKFQKINGYNALAY